MQLPFLGMQFDCPGYYHLAPLLRPSRVSQLLAPAILGA